MCTIKLLINSFKCSINFFTCIFVKQFTLADIDFLLKKKMPPLRLYRLKQATHNFLFCYSQNDVVLGCFVVGKKKKKNPVTPLILTLPPFKLPILFLSPLFPFFLFNWFFRQFSAIHGIKAFLMIFLSWIFFQTQKVTHHDRGWRC